MAGCLQVSERTVRNWKRGAREDEKPLGRPARSQSRRYRETLAVRRQVKAMGWGAGWRPIEAACGLPTRSVQEGLRVLKARHRKRLREFQGKNRISIEVLGKDVIWAQDAMQAGRVGSRAVMAEVVKDRGTLGNVALAVGGAATGAELVAMLENQKREGRLPLVLATDNGPAYKSREVAGFCEREKLVHLFSRHHLPQDNGAAERGIRELKEESGLGSGVKLRGVDEVVSRLIQTCRLLGNRPRACRGMKTSVQLEKDLPAGPEMVPREAFYEAACRAVEKAVQGGGNIRERRRIQRQVIYGLLERINLVRLVRGGNACRAQYQKPENNL